MSNLIFRVGNPKDAKSLAPRLRPADVEEIRVITGASPLQVLLNPFGKPPGMAKVYTIQEEDRVSGMFGVSYSSTLPNGVRIGCPWFLCTNGLIQRNFRRLIRVTDQWLEEIGRGYDVLENYVHDENEVHIRWLKYKKFEFVQYYPDFGVSKKAVWRFRKYTSGKALLRSAIGISLS